MMIDFITALYKLAVITLVIVILSLIFG